MSAKALLIVIFLFLASPVCIALHASVKAKHAMVVSAHGLASEAGVQIMRQGGNAVDAAVAVGFALAVVYPEAGNIGGGGFMLVRTSNGEAHVIDFRGSAPRLISQAPFLDSAGHPNDKSLVGYMSSCVPGTVAGLCKAMKEFGSKDIAEVIQPAIDLAEGGFVVDDRLEHALKANEALIMEYPATVQVFTKNGKMLRAGDTLRQPLLAATLERIRSKGEDGFYRGETARLIEEEMRKGGGLITRDDLESYHALIKNPVHGTYRGYEILAPPPVSSGGVCLIELFNIAEGFNLGSMGFHSSSSVHTITEIFNRVFADRSEYLGDPAFSNIPEVFLESKSYADGRRHEIDTLKATRVEDVRPGENSHYEGNHTTHYVVMDSSGNIASVTYTLNDLFGNKIFVTGAGFLLNNDIDDFSIKAGVPNTYGLVGSAANVLQPMKRPLSSMTPVIVLKDGKPLLTLGARGGPRIISAVFQVITNVIDYGFTLQEAVDAPRFHAQWKPDSLYYEKNCFTKDVLNRLQSMGHVVGESDDYLGRVEALYIDPETGLLFGAPDSREGGVAIGY